jgi:hypothetical protein
LDCSVGGDGDSALNRSSALVEVGRLKPCHQALASTNKSLAQMNKSIDHRRRYDEGFGPVSARAGKSRIVPSIRSANLPRPLMAGAFSVLGFAEQIFGVNEQISGQDQSD